MDAGGDAGGAFAAAVVPELLAVGCETTPSLRMALFRERVLPAAAQPSAIVCLNLRDLTCETTTERSPGRLLIFFSSATSAALSLAFAGSVLGTSNHSLETSS
ncbi:hypothetical protein D9M70_563450 [compost metagenome]